MGKEGVEEKVSSEHERRDPSTSDTVSHHHYGLEAHDAELCTLTQGSCLWNLQNRNDSGFAGYFPGMARGQQEMLEFPNPTGLSRNGRWGGRRVRFSTVCLAPLSDLGASCSQAQQLTQVQPPCPGLTTPSPFQTELLLPGWPFRITEATHGT